MRKKRDVYGDLGVPKDASAADIKRAYRRRAKAAHPDAGGSDGEFRALQVAYRTLGDEDRRRRYDETGEVDDGRGATADDKARDVFAKVLLQLVEANGSKLVNIVAEARSHVLATAAEGKRHAERLREQSRQFADAASRTRTKAKDADNFAAEVLASRGEELSERAIQVDAEVRVFERAAEMAEAYEYIGPLDPPSRRRGSADFAAMVADVLSGKPPDFHSDFKVW